MKKLIIIFFMLLLSATSFAGYQYQFNNKQQEQLFDQMTGQLRCLVCQNESIADSSAPLANDLRNAVYTMILQGKNQQQITQYMTSKYGNFILFKPPVVASTWLLWSAPVLFLLLGAVIFLRLCRQNSPRGDS